MPKTIIPIPTPKIRLSSIEDMRRAVQKKLPAPRKAKEKSIQIKRCYRLYKEHHRLLVVKLRYGSLTNFSEIKHSWVHIQRLTGI